MPLNRYTIIIVLAIALIGVSLIGGPYQAPLPPDAARPSPSESTPSNTAVSKQKQPSPTPVSVVRVIDGDTISVARGAVTDTVRLIGIDAPEIGDRRGTAHCLALKSASYARTLLKNKEVALTTDPTQGKRGVYGRLLAYVYLPDGTLVNERLIADGYAYEYTYNQPYQHQAAFKTAEKEARQNQRGLWASGVCENMPDEPTEEEVREIKTTPPDFEYTCVSNAYNCSDFKTHNEAQYVFESCGGTAKDVHRLDRDKDNLACESLPTE